MEFIVRSICLFLTEALKVELIMFGLLNYKSKKHYLFLIKDYILSIITLTVLIFLIKHYNFLPEKSIDYVIIIAVLFATQNSIEGKSKILITFITYTGASLIDIILIGTLQLFFNYSVSEKNYTYVLANALSILVISILIKVKNKLNSKISMTYFQFRKRYMLIILFGLIGCGFYSASMRKMGFTWDMKNYESYFSFGAYASGIAFIIICVALIILNDSNAQYKNLNEVNQRLLDQQRLYYQTLIDKEQYTKRFRHDINNHIYCMQHLCEQGMYNDLMEYLNDMQKYTSELNLDIQTGNNIANIIVNELYIKHKEDNILINWKGLLPETLRISSMDLCTIFSNLVTNAIEAVKNIDTDEIKVIDVEIKTLTTNLVVLVRNPVKEKINIINNGLVTTKKNKDQHGLGSLNVERAVRKYRGDIKYSCSENVFTVNIVLTNVVI